ncbi:MAG: pantoate--beta-alanine ligase [Saprospiraceae bacterium]|nr:pantoate--beta-alanine ligase [Saprospiraceae bacterium]
MRVFTTVNQLQLFLSERRSKRKSIAFVPTLGALHRGHLELMAHGKDRADIVVASIFVNPSQFNEVKDLEKYPRPLAHDIHLLCTNAVDVLFLPPEGEIYPENMVIESPVDISELASVMEGPRRPGHFEGVVTVVKRLLDIVQPDFLIMGQKDYQQQAIVGMMIRKLEIPTKLIVHPTERDADGLALSSRNARIEEAMRPRANTLFLTLRHALDLMQTHSPEEIIRKCSEMIKNQGFRLEYFSIVDGETLQSVRTWADHHSVVACVAAWLGDVRLIDNLPLK